MAICWDRRLLLSFKKWKRWIQTTGLSDDSKLDLLFNHRTLNNRNKTITEITTLIFWQFVETAGYFCHSKNESAEFKLPASVTIRSWIFYLIIELWIIVTRQLLKLQLWYFGSLLRQRWFWQNTGLSWRRVEVGYFCHSKNESAEFKLPASVTRRSWIFYLIIELWIIVTRQLLILQLCYFGNLLRPQGTSIVQNMKALNSNYRPQWRFEVGSFI